ncbi:hypothetical protein VPH35_021032 [Triticum aestivum]
MHRKRRGGGARQGKARPDMELAPLKARTGRCKNIGEDGEKIAGSLLARGKEILYLARFWIYINTKGRRRPELFHRRFILRPLEVPEEVKEDCYLQATVLKDVGDKYNISVAGRECP